MSTELNGASLETPPPPPPPFPGKPLAIFGLLLLAGVGLIALADHLELADSKGRPMSTALLRKRDDELAPNTYPLHARRLPLDNFRFESLLAREFEQLPESQKWIKQFNLDMREHLVMLPDDEKLWEELLESGRLPTRGKPEVLAGPLVRLDSFDLDGTTFRVVGTTHRVPAFTLVYLVPQSPQISRSFEEGDTSTGWFDPEGTARPADASHGMTQPIPRTQATAFLATLGIALVLTGGAAVQMKLLRWACGRVPGLGALHTSLSAYPRTLLGVHILLYGLFLGFMVFGLIAPVLNLRLMLFMSEVFTSGELSNIGQAYEAGSIPSATWHTFFNNFVQQTLLFTYVPAVLLPFVGSLMGLLKSFVSLALAGFVLAPLWVDKPGLLPLHSITLTLELQAYVVAAYLIVHFPLALSRAWRKAGDLYDTPAPWPFKGYLVGILVTGAMLAVAAFYEAVTLVRMMP